MPAYASWAVGPISWPVSALALAGVGATLWRARLPVQPFSWAYPVVWGWAAVAAVWLAWPVVRRATLHHYGWPTRVIKPMGRLYWVVPAVMLAMAAAAAQQLPAAGGVRVQPAGHGPAGRGRDGPPPQVFRPQWVGLFWAKNIGVAPNRGMMFVADDRDAHVRVGFARLRPGVRLDAVVVNPREQVDLGHGWWSWKQPV